MEDPKKKWYGNWVIKAKINYRFISHKQYVWWSNGTLQEKRKPLCNKKDLCRISRKRRTYLRTLQQCMIL